MDRVGIIGVGMTKFGERWKKGLRDLIAEAGLKTIQDANITGDKIDAIYGGSMSAGRFVGQEHIGAVIADSMGLNPIPSSRVEAACASGGLALREAYLSIKGGEYNVVVAGGVEKMTDSCTEEASLTLGGAGDQEWEVFNGATFPGLYALIARRHMHEYGTTEEQMAEVSVKNHANAAKNPLAQFQFEVSREQVMKSPKVADPLKLLDCSPITDGAAATVLASEEVAKEYCDDPVWIDASAQATDSLAVHDRKSITGLNAAKVATEKVFKKSSYDRSEIDLAEVHDCFSIAELCALEDMGFVKKGEAGKAMEEGRFNLNAELPINTSGGLKGCGHPVGATGIKQAIEITKQLRGEAGKRQVDEAEVGLTHNVGGSGATAILHILSGGR